MVWPAKVGFGIVIEHALVDLAHGNIENLVVWVEGNAFFLAKFGGCTLVGGVTASFQPRGNGVHTRLELQALMAVGGVDGGETSLARACGGIWLSCSKN